MIFYIYNGQQCKTSPRTPQNPLYQRQTPSSIINQSSNSSMNHAFPNLTPPTLCPLKPILMALVIQHGLVNLLLRIQHKGPILHHFLIQRQSRDEDELPTLLRVLGDLGGHGVAFLLEDDVVVLAHRRLVFADAKSGGAGEGVGEGVPADGEGLRHFAAGGDCDVEDPDGRVGELLDAVGAVGLAGDYLNSYIAVVDFYGRDLGRSEVAVSWLALLQFLGEVDPELHADVGAPVFILSRHFRVHDSASCGHELEVSCFDRPGVPGEVLVIHCAL